MPIGSKGHVPLIRFAALLNIDAQDRQDSQDKTLRHRKRTGSVIEWAFVGNIEVLRGPSRTPFESFPTPWNPLADSSFAPVTDPLAPMVEICSAFPTFGGSLLSFLQPLRGPSWIPFFAFVDNPQLFQVSLSAISQAPCTRSSTLSIAAINPVMCRSSMGSDRAHMVKVWFRK